ncbi:MAG: hypothetical protein AAB966_05475, partial [Patescibacteria group bacterium]
MPTVKEILMFNEFIKINRIKVLFSIIAVGAFGMSNAIAAGKLTDYLRNSDGTVLTHISQDQAEKMCPALGAR